MVVPFTRCGSKCQRTPRGSDAIKAAARKVWEAEVGAKLGAEWADWRPRRT